MRNFLFKPVTGLLMLMLVEPAVGLLGWSNQGPAPLLQKVTGGTAFSFVYGGKRSQDLLSQWKQTGSTKALDGARELQVTTYHDPATGLEITREITIFSETAAVECILHLRNTGT